MSEALKTINDQVEKQSVFVDNVLAELGKVIVGQRPILERLLMAILSDGHILLEGVPGLAKTLTVVSLSKAFNLSFKRIQFTPDLLPADVIGTLIYDPSTQKFVPKLGPIFSNIILADEINRAPAKVQSALLEAMQEKQVTIGENTYPIERPFLVMATQNPIEQEGTYPLPEAQVDRFIMKLTISYPKKTEEKQILEKMALGVEPAVVQAVASAQDIFDARKAVNSIYVDEKVKDYVLDLVFATREPEKYNMADLKPLIQYGASPRASIYLLAAAKAHAFVRRRGFVTPEDVKAIGRDVLRHRVIPTFEAEAEEMDSDKLVDRVFSEIEVP